MFVIPMVGQSSRFFKAGYKEPKFRLPIGGKNVFHYAVRSFEKYFETDKFLFLVRSDLETPHFVEAELISLGIRSFDVKVFDDDTRGQAETVHLGLKDYSDVTEIYIFNIDTFRPKYLKPDFINDCDGYLEVFQAEANHWSFVEPGPNQTVIRTTEKNRISDLCSDGLYYFGHKQLFDQAFLHALEKNDTINNEYYVAPLYNRLIEQGGKIRYDLIANEQVFFCGTPDEYKVLISQQDTLSSLYD